MIPKVIEARHVQHFTVYVRFSDGVEGDIDLRDELYGEIFAPLTNEAFFRKLSVHPEFHTLCWPNGADIAPEYLYNKLLVPARSLSLR